MEFQEPRCPFKGAALCSCCMLLAALAALQCNAPAPVPALLADSRQRMLCG